MHRKSGSCRVGGSGAAASSSSRRTCRPGPPFMGPPQCCCPAGTETTGRSSSLPPQVRCRGRCIPPKPPLAPRSRRRPPQRYHRLRRSRHAAAAATTTTATATRATTRPPLPLPHHQKSRHDWSKLDGYWNKSVPTIKMHSCWVHPCFWGLPKPPHLNPPKLRLLPHGRLLLLLLLRDKHLHPQSARRWLLQLPIRQQQQQQQAPQRPYKFLIPFGAMDI